jgi:hypothetical protein
MSKTVTRLFDSHTEALAATRELEASGVSHDHISLIANNAERWHDDDDKGERSHDDDNDTAEGAAKGATTGGLLGGGAGLLAGLGMLAIPGLGPVVAAGWLASTAAGAVAGALAGGATGGILGALKDAGENDDDAHVYAEGVRRGGSIVSVRADDAQAAQVEAILDRHRGVHARDRGEKYRESGWSRFDADAPSYTTDEIARERQLYRAGEERSFGGAEPIDRDPLLDTSDGRTGSGVGSPDRRL